MKRIWAAGNVDRIGHASNAVLVNGLSDQDRFVRELSSKLLVRSGWTPRSDSEKVAFLIARRQWTDVARLGEGAIGPLSELLGDEHRDVSNGAYIALKTIGGPAVVPLLKEVDTVDEARRDSVYMALAFMADERAVQCFIEGLVDRNVRVRGYSAFGLKRLGWRPNTDEQVLDYLVGRVYASVMIVDRLSPIDEKEMQMIMDGGNPMVKLLIERLGDDDAFARTTAMGMLGKMGAGAKDALPRLKEMIGEEEKLFLGGDPAEIAVREIEEAVEKQSVRE